MDEWRPIAPVDVEPTPTPQRRRLSDLTQHGRDLIVWMGVGRLVAIAVTIPLLGIGAYALLRTPSPPVETRIEFASTVPTVDVVDTSSATSLSIEVTVHVAGHVHHPGVYVLHKGQRIVDAIRAAGGAQPIADLDMINLAVLLDDGEQIYVPAVGEAVSSPVIGRVGSSSPSSSTRFPMNINSASASDLEALPGIGPSTAAAIIDHRTKVGPFESTSGLLDVPGIGTAKYEAIKDLVTT